jgi:hypothetical protein
MSFVRITKDILNCERRRKRGLGKPVKIWQDSVSYCLYQVSIDLILETTVVVVAIITIIIMKCKKENKDRRYYQTV